MEWTRLRLRKYREHKSCILRLSEFRDEHAGVENGPRSNERMCVWRALARAMRVLRTLRAPYKTKHGTEPKGTVGSCGANDNKRT